MAINLVKGQKISLEKESGGGLGKVTMGLGWDAESRNVVVELLAVTEDLTPLRIEAALLPGPFSNLTFSLVAGRRRASTRSVTVRWWARSARSWMSRSWLPCTRVSSVARRLDLDRGKYRDVILPFIVLRRLDAVLEATKDAVLERKKFLDTHKVAEQDGALIGTCGVFPLAADTFELRKMYLRPAARELSPTLVDLQSVAPDLKRLFRELGPLITASSPGLNSTTKPTP